MINITEENIITHIKSNARNSFIGRVLLKNKDLYNVVLQHTKYLDKYDNITFNERVYSIRFNYTEDNNKCEICKKNKKSYFIRRGYYRNWCEDSICKYTYLSINKDLDKEQLRIEKLKKTKSEFSKEKRDSIEQKKKQTFIDKYGVDCYSKTDEYKQRMIDSRGYLSPFESEEVRNKAKQTLTDRYGVDHNFKIEGMLDKINNTFIQNYGVHRASMNDNIKQKIIDTNNIKYGGNSPKCNEEVVKKCYDTQIKNFGKYGLANPLIFEKYKNTMMKRYGYEVNLHNPILLKKLLNSARKFKTYQYPSGRIDNIQGYEDYVIDTLLKTYNEDDIITSTKSISDNIGYIFYYLEDGTKHKYYPDIYIKSENKIIEVKSTYTYKKDYDINLLKQQACLNKGLSFEFQIISPVVYNKWKKLNKRKNK